MDSHLVHTRESATDLDSLGYPWTKSEGLSSLFFSAHKINIPISFSFSRSGERAAFCQSSCKTNHATLLHPSLHNGCEEAGQNYRNQNKKEGCK